MNRKKTGVPRPTHLSRLKFSMKFCDETQKHITLHGSVRVCVCAGHNAIRIIHKEKLHKLFINSISSTTCVVIAEVEVDAEEENEWVIVLYVQCTLEPILASTQLYDIRTQFNCFFLLSYNCTSRAFSASMALRVCVMAIV